MDAQLHAGVTDTRIAKPLVVAVPAKWMMDLDLTFGEAERTQGLNSMRNTAFQLNKASYLA